MLLLDEKAPQDLIDKVIEMDSFANNIYQKAVRVLQDKEGYLAYIRAEQAERDYDASIEYANKEGKIEGRKEGKIEGRKEGKIEGRKEGKREEKIEIAINLKNDGFPIEAISKATGLTLEEIEKL